MSAQPTPEDSVKDLAAELARLRRLLRAIQDQIAEALGPTGDAATS